MDNLPSTIVQDRNASSLAHTRAALQTTTAELVQALKNATQAAEQQVKHLTETETSAEQVSTTSSLLKRQLRDIASISEKHNEQQDDHILARLQSLNDGIVTFAHLFGYRHDVLEKIVRTVQDDVTHHDTVWWRIIEECYDQSLCGLCADADFVSEAKASEVLPFKSPPLSPDVDSSDSESPTYEADYHCSHDLKCVNRAWTKFWADALAQCRHGATIFWPTRNNFFDTQTDLPNAPQYIFRVFEMDTPQNYNEAVAMSPTSLRKRFEHEKINVLSLAPSQAVNDFTTHLVHGTFEDGSRPNNFISWSSSLPLEILNAVSRYEQRVTHSSSIYICAIDTTKFPRGQFAKYNWLLRYLDEFPGGDLEFEDFLPGRVLKSALAIRDDAWADKYLSQGIVHHGGRSCVFSLVSLIESGLFDICPNYRNLTPGKYQAERDDLWSNVQHTTSRAEVQRACDIAMTCLSNLPLADMALLILMCKGRITKAASSTDQEDVNRQGDAPRRVLVVPKGPPEVRRSYERLQAFHDAYGRHTGPHRDHLDFHNLQEFFCC